MPAVDSFALVPPYRGVEPVLDEVKVDALQSVIAQQAEIAARKEGQDAALEAALDAQVEVMRAAVAASRPGFQRPAAVMAMCEQRTQEEEVVYKEWLENTVAFHKARSAFKKQFLDQDVVHSMGQVRAMSEKQSQIQGLYSKCKDMRAALIGEAQKDPRFSDDARVPLEEMRQRQAAVFQDLRNAEAGVRAESARLRTQSREARMEGIRKMQAQQRALAGRLRLEAGQSAKRMSDLMSDANENGRRLTVTSPTWLQGVTARRPLSARATSAGAAVTLRA